MKVLITGISGFIARYLAHYYISNGHEVIGWDIVDSKVAGVKNETVDICCYEDVEKRLDNIKPDIIYHCAGSADVNKSVQHPDVDLRNNYITTHNLLFSLKKVGLISTKFVLMSSAAVYGNPYHLPIDETTERKPVSPYALHKQAAEDVCIFMHDNYKISTKIMRIFSTYGPGLKKQIFWDMYQKIKETNELKMFGSGYESRDYIYIDDLVEAITLAVEKSSSDEVVFNIANGEETEIREVARIFSDVVGIDKNKISFMGTLREGDPINWRADIQKIEGLGYVKKVSLEEGIKKYVDWLIKSDL